MYRLIVTSDAGVEHTVDVAREVALAGRRAGADVPLPHADVAGVHFRLERQGARVTLVDAGSDRGTSVNGARVPSGGRRELADGDTIEVAGRFTLRFHARSPAAEATGEQGTAALARAMVREMLASLAQGGGEAAPSIEVLSGPAAGRSFELPAPGKSLLLGRGETCDAPIRDPDLSREHLRFDRDWSGTSVSELGSKNGSRVNGVRLEVGVALALRDGDRVEAGATVLAFRDPAEAYLRQIQANAADAEAAASAPAPAGASAPAPAGASAPAPAGASAPAPAGASVPAPAAATAPPAATAPAPAATPWPTYLLATLLIAGAIAAIVYLLRS
jgi:pSer/pThr/pTyr-binding forkhead associated (FHA) protein